MPHLILARRQGETINIRLANGADPATLLEHLGGDGIDVNVIEIDNRRVKLSIEAPRELMVLRGELLDA